MIDVAARFLLAPVLMWQARQVRAAALRLPDAAGPRSGIGGEGSDIRL